MAEQVKAVNSQTFEQEVLKEELPVVVDFWATWCGPCRSMAPVLDQMATRFAGRVKVVKVDVDQEQALASAFQVQSIPTLAVLYQGALLGTVKGFGGPAHLEQLFEEAAKVPERVAEARAREADEGGGGDA